MEDTAIVTGGTGGLGAAVVGRLLDERWRVVVPWIAERELERVKQREGLELVQADLVEKAAFGVGDRVPQATVAVLCGQYHLSQRATVNLVDHFTRAVQHRR